MIAGDVMDVLNAKTIKVIDLEVGGDGTDSTNHYLKFMRQTGFNSNDLERGIQFMLDDGTTVRGYIKMDSNEDLQIKCDNLIFNLAAADGAVFNADGSAPTAPTKAIVEMVSTTKGFLPPRMTGTQRDAITSVPTGLIVYNTTTNKINVYTGSAWEAVTSA